MNKRCSTECPGSPCALLRAADQVEERIPVADFETELLKDQVVQADADILAVELRIDLAYAVGENIDASLVTQAFDQGFAADAAYHDHLIDTVPIRMQGKEWVEQARSVANTAMSECDGPIHGIRVPFLDLIIPTPAFVGKDHCGAPNEYLPDLMLDMAQGSGMVIPEQEYKPSAQ